MLTVMIPMAGQGKRFSDAGYNVPKPFISVGGMPMIQRVVQNLPRWDRLVLCVLEDHIPQVREIFGVSTEIHVVPIEGVTEGAACTACIGIEAMNDPDGELIIAGCDQWVDWEPTHFLKFCRREKCDGALPTFYATHPKWSFCHVEKGYEVTAVVEKQPISTYANVGIYYYRKASMFFNAAHAMIKKNMRVNGEFYVAPAYNEMILEGAKIINYTVPKMYGLGTPEDMQASVATGVFLDHNTP